MTAEVYYRIQVSLKGADDWCFDSSHIYDTLEYARRALRASDDMFEFRIVKITIEVTALPNAANARLIAAAADLLEALKLALPYVQKAYDCAFPDGPENEAVESQIIVAIAKAEGYV